MKQSEREKINEFLIPWVKGYVFCFSNESTDKWKKIFCKKRLETFLATDKDMIEEVTGRNLKEFKQIYEELFLSEVEKYLVELKKAKTEEAKDEIRKNGVKANKKSKKK